MDTAAALAVNVADVEAAGMMIVAGTVTLELLLARATETPPFGAEPDRVTLQESARDPVIDELPHVIELRVGVAVDPSPVRVTL